MSLPMQRYGAITISGYSQSFSVLAQYDGHTFSC